MLSSLRPFPGAYFEGYQRLSVVHHWCISMEALLLSHITWNQIFIINIPLFCVKLLWICCESDGVLVGGQWPCPLPSKCVQQFWLGCAFPVPSFPGSGWHRTAGDTRAGDDAIEATACCTCGCSRRCWSQYYKPKPQALPQFTAYLCVQNMRFVSLSWVFLLAIDVTWYKQCEFESSVKC